METINIKDLKAKAKRLKHLKGIIYANLDLKKIKVDQFGKIKNNEELNSITDEQRAEYDTLILITCITTGQKPPVKVDTETLNPEQIQRIQQAQPLVKAKKKAKNGFLNLCAKDGARPVMGGVFHVEGKRVATDAYVLAVHNCEYNPESEGKIIDKNGFVVEGRYLNYKAVIPQKNTHEPGGTVNTQRAAGSLANLAKIAPDQIHIKAGNSYFSPSILYRLFCAAVDCGIYEVDAFYDQNPIRTAIFDAEGFTGLAMPVLYDKAYGDKIIFKLSDIN